MFLQQKFLSKNGTNNHKRAIRAEKSLRRKRSRRKVSREMVMPKRRAPQLLRSPYLCKVGIDTEALKTEVQFIDIL